jgi:hypothetical protein
MDVKSTWIIEIKWIIFHDHLDYSQKLPLGDMPNTKIGDYDTPKSHDH